MSNSNNISFGVRVLSPVSTGFDQTVAAGSAIASIDLSSELSVASPDEYEADIMPDGVTLNDATGLISGTPIEPGYFEIFCQGRGTGAEKLTRTINVTAPVTEISTAAALESALADHEANGTEPAIFELANGDYDATLITAHKMSHWCLIRSAGHSTDHSTITNWTGGARFVGNLLLGTSQKMRFEHVKFYIAKTGGAANDQSGELMVEVRGSELAADTARDLHFGLCEFYSDTIDKSQTGYAGNWPDAGPSRVSGINPTFGLHVDRCHYHDVNAGPAIRSSDYDTETSEKRRSYLTRNAFIDMGREAGSFNGSYLSRKWNILYGNHATAMDGNPFHATSFSYNGPDAGQHYNVLNESNIAYPITRPGITASGIKLDNTTTTDTAQFRRSTIVGNLVVAADNVTIEFYNGTEDSVMAWNAVVYNRDSSIDNVVGITDVGGIGATIDASGLVLDVSADNPDLSNVPTDGSYSLLVITAGGEDKGYRIVAVDDAAKTITLNTELRNTSGGPWSWSVNNIRSNPSQRITTGGGRESRLVVADNFHSTFAGVSRNSATSEHMPPERNIIGTGFIANGDGSAEDAALWDSASPGDTDVAFEDAFDGTSFVTVPRADILTTFNIKTGGPLDVTATAPYGIGPIGPAFDWPADFPLRPSGVLRKAKLPDWTPDTWSIPSATGVATSTLTESAAVQITGMGDNVPVRISDDADASTDFQILDTDGTTVLRNYGDPKVNSSISVDNALMDSGQYVKIRRNSSASAVTQVTADLHVGTSTATFTVETA